MVDFNKAESSDYTRNGRFFSAGRHLCRVLVAKEAISKKNNANCEMVVAELEVIESTPISLGILHPEEVAAGKSPNSLSEPIPAGEVRTWLMKNDGATKSMFLGMVKQFGDVIKGSVRSQTKAVIPEGHDGAGTPVLAAEVASELVQLADGTHIGFNLAVPGAVAAELQNIWQTPQQLAAMMPLWVVCQRTKTTRGGVIDGVQFEPLTPADIERHGGALGLF